jgi:hypothetical protein
MRDIAMLQRSYLAGSHLLRFSIAWRAVTGLQRITCPDVAKR